VATSRTSARAHDLATPHAPLGVGVAADRTHGLTGLTTVEREELARLRRENGGLQEERDIPKKPRPFREHQR
jgi:transposase-like protein